MPVLRYQVNGPGCRPVYPSNLTSVDPFRPLRRERVLGCVLDYVHVETLHAGLQCVLAVSQLRGVACSELRGVACSELQDSV